MQKYDVSFTSPYSADPQEIQHTVIYANSAEEAASIFDECCDVEISAVGRESRTDEEDSDTSMTSQLRDSGLYDWTPIPSDMPEVDFDSVDEIPF